jgi:hypothetical protein
MRRGFKPKRARATETTATLQPSAAAIAGALSPRSHISCSNFRRSGVQLMRDDLTLSNFVKISAPVCRLSLLNRPAPPAHSSCRTVISVTVSGLSSVMASRSDVHRPQ